jgi:tRNA pseudouridine38-40 synthase
LKVKITVEYAGEAFKGWQSQGELLTVQGSLESALEIFLKGEAKKTGVEAPEKIFIQGSGRTDSGVHARAQVASFLWPTNLELSQYKLKDALNALTHPALTVHTVEEVDDSFDARHSPHIKCYSYKIIYRGGEPRGARLASIDANRGWVVTKPLDIRLMIESARVLEGQHDFQAFRAIDCGAKSTVRTVIRSELVRTSSSEMIYVIYGKGFLKQMVRIIVGSLVELGSGDLKDTSLKSILEGRDRAKAGKTAPAEGLYLEWVRYEGANLL